MATATVTVRLDETVIEELDRLVQTQVYPDRDRAIQDAVSEQLRRLRRHSLAEECAKLIPAEEQALSEEGLRGGASWPQY